MKNLILLFFLSIASTFLIPTETVAQAHSIKIGSTQDNDSLYVMLTDTVYSKYRHGKGKWVNTTDSHAENTFDGCRTYTAVITQASTNAPTASIRRNNLVGTPTYAYTGVGVYTATLSGGGLTTNKTWANISVGNATGLVGQIYTPSDSTFVVKVFDATGAAANLAGTANIEVRVYP